MGLKLAVPFRELGEGPVVERVESAEVVLHRAESWPASGSGGELQFLPRTN